MRLDMGIDVVSVADHAWFVGHDPSEFYEGGLEKGKLLKIEFERKVRRPVRGGPDEH